MKKNFTLLVFLILTSMFSAQYKQGEYKEEIFPKTKFDSLDAKMRLAEGNVTMHGVAFTRARSIGKINPEKVYANKITVNLFPLSPYFQEWYTLKTQKENLKKGIVVYMTTQAYRYRLTCETNSKGEFTFPKMKPGKYILMGNLPWTLSGSYNQYTGSAYGNGGVTNYYEKKYYSNDYEDLLIRIVEVKAGDKVANVKLK
ncbi:hypothetical protein [Chryseobacterium sp. YIM B08800]|uniref:hypothetical protein n=1 Tax=Chryseobacterium sp. YIM B08800 TaxID=2984136 RepID=UPI00223EDFD6|nr:hypothetical protein [Chryseobacterium sp. YIM B08800]